MSRERKSTGRITEERKVLKRSHKESERPQQAIHQIEIEEKAERYTKIKKALKALNLPDLDISEVTAVETFTVGDQIVTQLKTGDFVKIAMVTSAEESYSDEM